MKTIFTSLSPNLENDDVALTFRTIVQPWSWVQGNATSAFQNAFADYLDMKSIFTFDSGRSALYTLLTSLRLDPQSEVLLQSYTCVAVPDPVIWAGAKPIYVDIDPVSFNMNPADLKKKITRASRVLIIQHTFGNPADLDALLKIAREHDLFVVEDCTHALGATYKGKKVGTFGDASFFSTGRDKVISSVFGGVLAIKDRSLAKTFDSLYSKLPHASVFWTLQQLLHPLISALVKPLYNTCNIGKALLRVSLALGLLSRAVYPEEKRGGKPSFVGKRMPNALCILALHQFHKLTRFNTHRRSLADFYTRQLTGLSYTLPSQTSGSEHIFLRYTILTPHSNTILKEANKQGLVLGDWYNAAIAPSGVDYKTISYDPASSPEAENVSKMSLNLPTHITTTHEDAERIVAFLKGVHGRN